MSNRPTLDELARCYSERQADAPPPPLTAEALARREDCRSLADRVAALTSERGRSLDVGSGRGGFSFHLARAGFRPLELIDLDPASEAAVRLIPESRFHRCGFEDFSVAEDGGRFSTIVMSQVLEHALEPVEWLRRARQMLSPQGVIAVAVPNFAGLYRLLGRRDPFFIPPFHLNYFTPRSLRRAMEQAGLRVVTMDTRSNVAAGGDEGRDQRPLRVMLGRAWNAGSWMLNPTRFGIILRLFARRGNHRGDAEDAGKDEAADGR